MTIMLPLESWILFFWLHIYRLCIGGEDMQKLFDDWRPNCLRKLHVNICQNNNRRKVNKQMSNVDKGEVHHWTRRRQCKYKKTITIWTYYFSNHPTQLIFLPDPDYRTSNSSKQGFDVVGCFTTSPARRGQNRWTAQTLRRAPQNKPIDQADNLQLWHDFSSKIWTQVKLINRVVKSVHKQLGRLFFANEPSSAGNWRSVCIPIPNPAIITPPTFMGGSNIKFSSLGQAETVLYLFS